MKPNRYLFAGALFLCFMGAAWAEPSLAPIEWSPARSRLTMESRTPAWEEFCPAPYLKAVVNPQAVVNPPPSPRPRSSYLGVAEVVVTPLKLFQNQQIAAQKETQYWAQRHLAFSNALAFCEQRAASLQGCYATIRHHEAEANQAHEAQTQLEAFKQETRQERNQQDFLRLYRIRHPNVPNCNTLPNLSDCH